MATLSIVVSRGSTAQPVAIARATITITYSTSTGNTAVSVTASQIKVGSISASGGTSTTQTMAKNALSSALSSMTATLAFGGQTVASKTGLSANSTYSVSGTKSVNRGTTTSTATVKATADGMGSTTSVSIPALQSWDVTYDANSGTGAPTTQKKYYGIDLTLSSAIPSKDGYVFKGWSASDPSSGVVDYASGVTYTANQALALVAVWELAYTKPIINNLRIDRCTQNGTLDDDGTYALVAFNWSVYVSLDARYYGGSTAPYASNSPVCGITVGSITATPTLTGTSASVIVGNGTFDTDTQYNVSVTLSDTQVIVSDNSVTVESMLSTAKFPIDINPDATAIGFLTPAPDNDAGVFVPDYSGIRRKLFDLFYPVGSYYETSDTTFDPNTAWGGRWELEIEGQFHVSSGANYPISGALTNTTDGGQPSVTLTASQSGVPAHSHTATDSQYFMTNDQASANNANVALYSTGTRRRADIFDTTSNIFHHNRSTANNTATDATSAHENRPPFIVVNRWHRIA